MQWVGGEVEQEVGYHSSYCSEPRDAEGSQEADGGRRTGEVSRHAGHGAEEMPS